MTKSKKILPLLSVLVLVAGSFLFFFSVGPVEADAPPSRSLYLMTENYNISFSKPTFYGSDDPYYTKDVEANDWDDIAIVVFFQDRHKYNVQSGSYTLSVADMYQAVFAPLNGTQRSTGTTRTVLMEDVTAAWCGPCTGIIGAMDRLNHDSSYFPDKYIGIEYHSSSSSDVYYKTVSATKANYYSIPGYPTVIIDGTDASVGGSSSANSSTIDSNLKSRINTAAAVASPLSIVAVAGHNDNNAWVNFTVKVEDSNFDNIMVDCNVALIQDAHPRRHNANNDARLGWILNDMSTFRVFNIQGSDPVISNVLPSEDSVLSGIVEISFDVTDADASDSKITNKVEVRPAGGVDWVGIAKKDGKFNWNTAAKTGEDYLYPDGDYEIRITSTDFWDETSQVSVDVSVLNPDVPELQLNKQLIEDQLDDGVIEGELDIIWIAEDDEDGTDLSIDLLYMRPGQEWTIIAENLTNVGTYTWDTFNPRIPDQVKYSIMVKATDSDDMFAEIAGTFYFEINNPDPPTVEIVSPAEGKELSGKPSIRWTAEDDEDSQSKLTIDIDISEDEGVTYSPLITGVPNTGSYLLDTSYYTDSDGYKVKITVTDTTGRTAEAESGIFSIYNNDIPECRIVEPAEDDMVSDTITVEWTSNDQEDAPEDMTFSLYYMFSGGTFWKEIATNEPNTGSFDLDTLDLEEGDGVYTLRLLVTDSRGELSDAYTVFFTVYNPDTPEVISASGPTDPVAKAASFTWYAEDEDPAETDGLKVWFYYSTDGVEWTAVAEGLPNIGSYTMDVSNFDDGAYKVKMIVADCQPGEYNRTVEYLFMDITVDNNDGPTVEMTSSPDPSIEHEDSISFAWSGDDPEDDKLLYTAYYRVVGDSGWTTVPGVFRVTTTSFIWDISTLPGGDYELKIIVVEDTRDSFEAEVITTAFTVKEKSGTIMDDDDDDDIITPADTGDDGNLALILGIVVAIVVLLILGLVIGGLVIMNKRKAAATQLPPPGGLPAQPPAPGLPGQVSTGQLPATPAQQPELPPAQTPEAPQPEAPVEPAPVQEQPPAAPQEVQVVQAPEPQPAPAPAPAPNQVPPSI